MAGTAATIVSIGGASGLGSTRVAPELGIRAHLFVGSAASFVAPSLRQGSPMCVSGNGTSHVCYSPAFIRQAYDYPTGVNAPTGAGQTIVIVDAFGSATIEEDLAAFGAEFGLPPASLTILGPNGLGDPSDPNVFGWAVETSFDVEWAHAMAPGANIVLSVAASDDTADMLTAVEAALAAYPGAIVSQSWGVDENDPDPATQAFITALHGLYQGRTVAGTLVASVGDFGATDGTDTIVASYPASDPLVLAVGGTQGKPYPDGLWRRGEYGKQSVWNESREDTFYAATGGAPSILFPAPSWQQPFSHMATRTVPDVSYNSAIDGGALVFVGPDVFTFGGTSAAPPQWAAIVALANELRARKAGPPLGSGAAPALYELAGDPKKYKRDFHDIKDGNNILVDQELGFEAGPGYDLASGLGTPDVASLIADLAGVRPPPPPPKPTNVTCANQQLTGTYRNVTVAKGTWCDLQSAIVLGDLHADRASGIGITGSLIAGHADVDRLNGAADPFHPGANAICRSTVSHDLKIEDSGAGTAWAIGGPTCANVVGGDLRFVNNRAGGDITGNAIRRDLDCHGNGAVTGGDNQVGGRLRGQCAGLGAAPVSSTVSPAR